MVSYKAQEKALAKLVEVLILIVVDDGLVHSVELTTRQMTRVLILIVVDDGLVLLLPLLFLSCEEQVLILIVVDDGLVRGM